MSAQMMMYVTQAFHGLTYGMLLFLVASGLTIIFGMMGILNLAHASFFMLSAYIGYSVLSLTNNFWAALLIAPIAIAIIGMLIERFLLRRVKAQGHFGQLLLTMGLMLVTLEAVKYFWGTEGLSLAIPPSLRGLVSIGPIRYPLYRLSITVLSLIVLLIMILAIYKTRIGKIVQATVSNSSMVSALGINTELVFTLVFGFGSWLAGVAGIAAAPMLSIFPGMADQVGMDAFVVVVVGGLGSLGGAFLASLLIGELTAFGIQFIPRLAPVLLFAFMAMVLIIKPTGFFGEKDE
jgi:branched-chain amino acid transport system permease protein